MWGQAAQSYMVSMVYVLPRQRACTAAQGTGCIIHTRTFLPVSCPPKPLFISLLVRTSTAQPHPNPHPQTTTLTKLQLEGHIFDLDKELSLGAASTCCSYPDADSGPAPGPARRALSAADVSLSPALSRFLVCPSVRLAGAVYRGKCVCVGGRGEQAGER